MKKRSLLWLLLLLIVPLLLFGNYVTVFLVDGVFHEPGVDATLRFGSLNVIKYSMIDPATILTSINQGNQSIFNFKSGFPPDDSPLVTSVEWKQVDYVNLATSIFQVTWNESINDWKLYEMGYDTECDNLDGFYNGEFLYYLETSDNKQYSARGIRMEPKYGYVWWGGDTYYRRPLFGWKAINLKAMTVTAEEALRRAEESGGMEARQSWGDCYISVVMWPEVFGRDDWWVRYWDNNTNDEAVFWISAK
jgi:hypothetical protein